MRIVHTSYVNEYLLIMGWPLPAACHLMHAGAVLDVRWRQCSAMITINELTTFVAAEVGLADRILAAHVTDDHDRCRACPNGAAVNLPWPCQLQQAATAVQEQQPRRRRRRRVGCGGSLVALGSVA